MDGRIRSRKEVDRVFQHFFTFLQQWPPVTTNDKGTPAPPTLSYSFPLSGAKDPIVGAVGHFLFPTNMKLTSIESFAFVITSEDGRWKFGYCRQEPVVGSIQGIEYHKSTVFISELPYWNALFYKALNYLAGISKWANAANTFLETFYNTKMSAFEQPDFILEIRISGHSPAFRATTPRNDQLPSTLENRCLSEFYNSFKSDTMMTLFASLLAERNIVIVSKKLSTLSSVVLACNLILNPLCWQHIFIPVLPASLTDYLEAPMPFVIGVPSTTWKAEAGKRFSISSRCVQVDADADTVFTPYPSDLNSMPKDMTTFLKKNLKREGNPGRNLANTFLQVFVKLIGHYEMVASRIKGKFDSEFVNTAKSSHRSYLRNTLLKSQMLQQFIQEQSTKTKNNADEDFFHKEIHKGTFILPESSISSRNYPPGIPTQLSLPEGKMPFDPSSSMQQSRQVKPFQRNFSGRAANVSLPPPRPRPKPNSGGVSTNPAIAIAPPIQRRAQTCDPVLTSQWENVLSDLKAANPEPTTNSLERPKVPEKPALLKKTNKSVQTSRTVQESENAKARGQEQDQDLIDFDAPAVLPPNLNPTGNNARAFWEGKEKDGADPNELLKTYKFYSKGSKSNNDLLF